VKRAYHVLRHSSCGNEPSCMSRHGTLELAKNRARFYAKHEPGRYTIHNFSDVGFGQFELYCVDTRPENAP
jgi:hypothetical protein